VPVTLDFTFSVSYTISGIAVPIPDLQRSGNFPDAGVAIANGTLDPPKPKVTIVKVERERINGYVSATATTPIKFFVNVAPGPAFDFSCDASICPSGFVLKGGQIELAITFNTGKTQQVTQPISSSTRSYAFSVPRPDPGAEGKSFAAKITGTKAEFASGTDLRVTVARQTITL
jgi:hypothetical protein